MCHSDQQMYHSDQLVILKQIKPSIQVRTKLFINKKCFCITKQN